MARTFPFDVDAVVAQLNRILEMELAAVIYYTHYSFMIYGHARIPITSWLRDNATESLAHAQEAGQMIMRLHKRPALGIAPLPTTRHIKSAALAGQQEAADARIRSTVESIIADVARRGDAAVREMSERFDKWSPAELPPLRGRACGAGREGRAADDRRHQIRAGADP